MAGRYKTMSLVIEKKIAEAYPDLRIGVLVARGINNRGKSQELEDLKQRKTHEFRHKFILDTLYKHPYIFAWQETYRSFGVKPKKNPPTAEALLMRLLKGADLPTISKVVDLYLVVETEFLLPIGGYDLDRISGDIVLRFSDGSEPFLPLGANKEEFTKHREVVYANCERVLTRKWNYRDCDYSKIIEDSTNIILLTEAALATISTDHILDSLDGLKKYMGQFCGGNIRTFLADVKHSLEWEL